MSSIDAIKSASETDYAGYPAAKAAETGTGIDFASMIADALKEEIAQLTITSSPNASTPAGGMMPMQMQGQSSGGIEQMILAAASTGETTDAQTALFMLCMMMQTDQDGEFSMLMQMMAAMLNQIQGEASALRNTTMASQYDPYVLDTIDWNVFGSTMAGLYGEGGTILPVECWRPATPSYTSDEENRSAELYRSVIDQFKVESAERYRPFRDGSTYCNIFMWDVTSAMGAEIPHYTDPDTGEARYYPDIKGATAMTAAMIDEWLKVHGEEYGWRQVDAETAQQYANEGKPAVTTGGSLDHVQVVCPSKDGEYDPIRGVAIAQAGRIVTGYTHITSVYSAAAMEKVSYFVHD